MSTVKITELPLISSISANTSNTLFLGVDIPTLATGKMTATTLAQGLYSNNILNVGINPVLYSNVIGQFSSSSNTYLQINLQNFNANGSGDIVVSTSDSDNSNSYIDMGISGNNYNDVVTYGAFKAYDGYLYTHGPTANGAKGNLIIGTASANANIMLMVGGTQPNNIMGWITKNSITLNTQSFITFSDGTRQTTAAATNAFTQAAFAQANLASANTVTIQGTNTTQNTWISSNSAFTLSAFSQANSANVLAQAAFNKANNALANSSGTFAGNLTITGNTSVQSMNTANLVVNGTANVVGALNVTGIVSMNAQLVLTNTTFSASQAALTISATPNVAIPTQAGTLLQLSSKANTPGRMLIDSFGVTQNSAYSIIAGRSARGTVDAPTASQSGDILFRLAGNGYGTTGFAPLGVGRIDIVATENYTDTSRGSKIIFYNNLNGSNTPIQIASFNASEAEFYGYVNPQKGFVYNPRIYPGAQTAITIDVANDSMVRAQTSTGLTVTLSNLLQGKEVVAWFTNTSGGNQTFTHGVPALNSTTNSTTYTIPGTSTILVRYMCIDGTAQNTFVSVTHA
jgi:hypothetical protein